MSEVIDLGEMSEAYAGQTVTVKTGRSWAAAKRIAGRALRPVATPDMENEQTEEIEFVVDLLAQGLAVLEEHVIEWTLPLPATRAGFLHDDFDEELGDWLVARIGEIVEDGRRSKSRVA
jgi:hypothetical protein